MFGTGPLEHTLRESYGRHNGIQINGHADATRIADEMSRAELTVCPSECYENNPLSVIESFAAGTPVLGADIGGIPELITPSSGMLFEPGSPDAFIGAIRGMLIRSWDHAAIKADAMDRFSASRHLNLLSKLL